MRWRHNGRRHRSSGGWVADRLGRRPTLLAVAATFIAGIVVASAVDYAFSRSYYAAGWW